MFFATEFYPGDEVLAWAVAQLEAASDRHGVFLTHGAFRDGGFHDNYKHLEGADLERANSGTEIREWLLEAENLLCAVNGHHTTGVCTRQSRARVQIAYIGCLEVRPGG